MTPPPKDLSNDPHYAYGSLCACGDLLTAHRTHAKSHPPSIAVVAPAATAAAAAAAAVSKTEVVASEIDSKVILMGHEIVKLLWPSTGLV